MALHNACSSAGKHVSSGGFYTEVILCMLLLQNFMTVINLSCLSDISDFPTLDQIYLRNVAMRQVRVADVFVDSVFIMVYNHGLS